MEACGTESLLELKRSWIESVPCPDTIPSVPRVKFRGSATLGVRKMTNFVTPATRAPFCPTRKVPPDSRVHTYHFSLQTGSSLHLAHASTFSPLAPPSSCGQLCRTKPVSKDRSESTVLRTPGVGVVEGLGAGVWCRTLGNPLCMRDSGPSLYLYARRRDGEVMSVNAR